MQLAVLAVMLASASAAMTLDASSDKIASSTYSATGAFISYSGFQASVSLPPIIMKILRI
jgi:hypothetical protein